MAENQTFGYDNQVVALALVGGALGYLTLAPRMGWPLPNFLKNGNGTARRVGGRVGNLGLPYDSGTYTPRSSDYFGYRQPSLQPRVWGDSGSLHALNAGHSKGGRVHFLGSGGGSEYVDGFGDGDEFAWSAPSGVTGSRNAAGGRHSVLSGSYFEGDYSGSESQTPGGASSAQQLDRNLPTLF